MYVHMYHFFLSRGALCRDAPFSRNKANFILLQNFKDFPVKLISKGTIGLFGLPGCSGPQMASTRLSVTSVSSIPQPSTLFLILFHSETEIRNGSTPTWLPDFKLFAIQSPLVNVPMKKSLSNKGCCCLKVAFTWLAFFHQSPIFIHLGSGLQEITSVSPHKCSR